MDFRFYQPPKFPTKAEIQEQIDLLQKKVPAKDGQKEKLFILNLYNLIKKIQPRKYFSVMRLLAANINRKADILTKGIAALSQEAARRKESQLSQQIQQFRTDELQADILVNERYALPIKAKKEKVMEPKLGVKFEPAKAASAEISADLPAQTPEETFKLSAAAEKEMKAKGVFIEKKVPEKFTKETWQVAAKIPAVPGKISAGLPPKIKTEKMGALNEGVPIPKTSAKESPKIKAQPSKIAKEKETELSAKEKYRQARAQRVREAIAKEQKGQGVEL